MRKARGRAAQGAALVCLGLLGWAAFMTFLVNDQAVSDDRSGRLVAVFAPGTSRQEALGQLGRTDARLVSDSALPFIWTVYSDQPDLAGRLRRLGAVGVFPDTGLFQCLSLVS